MSTEFERTLRAEISRSERPEAIGRQSADSPASELLFAEIRKRLEQFSGEFQELAEAIGGVVVQINLPDLKMAMTRARLVLELLMRDVYKRRLQAPAGRRALDELINTLAKQNQIPRNIHANAQMVRILGNAGPHEVEREVNLEEVECAIQQLLRIVDWYVDASRSGALDLQAERPTNQTPGGNPPSEPRALGIVPKGLRSFGSSDHKFFLQLLPGPRDDEGLPESIRFWKDRIEATGEIPFEVGVLYGPSGCGKSSLVKAGLLPHLDQARLRTVYLEASSDDTEARLLHDLRKRCNGLTTDLDLKQSIEAICQGKGFQKNKKQKVFIVLDQFEQWLNAHRGEQDTELARALRQCDGERVQALLMVREDFLGDASRFLDDLHIVLSRSQNTARVDLFDWQHARNVLAAFGLAYGRLSDPLAPEQEAFVEQAVEGLSEDRRVVCVRLSLFADMFKEKTWDLKTLEAVGGIEKVGTTFLEETFSASSAHAQRRKHQEAARAAFKALLPEEGTDIKGQKRSESELRAACGYENRPDDFSELMEILNTDLRLISPAGQPPDSQLADSKLTGSKLTGSRLSDCKLADSELTGSGLTGSAEAAEAEPHAAHAAEPSADPSYQLTHDFLVPALREWLDREQQKTRHGRAGLLIARRASMWKGRHERRFLPSPREYLVIRTLTDSRTWTATEREMMKRARTVHLRRGAMLLGCLALLACIAWMVRNRITADQSAQNAAALVETLKSDEMASVGDTIGGLKPYLPWAGSTLKEVQRSGSPDEQLKASLALALLGVDTGGHQIKYLTDALLNPNSDPASFRTLCDLLLPFAGQIEQGLQTEFESDSVPEARRFRAGCALAVFAPSNNAIDIGRWSKLAPFIADHLVKTFAQTSSGSIFVDQLRPRRSDLIDPLSAIYRDSTRPPSEHVAATTILAQYAKDSPEKLVGLVADAGKDPNSFLQLYDSLTSGGARPAKLMAGQLSPPLPAKPKDADCEAFASHVANAAVALLKLRQPEQVWPLLARPDDPKSPLAQAYPRVRSFIIHRIALLGCDPVLVIDRLNHESDPAVRQALILTLGEFTKEQLPERARQPMIEHLTAIYRTAADCGLRGAAEWLLRSWGQESVLAPIDHDLIGQHPEGQSWYLNSEGQTMVVVHAPGKVQVGSPRSEANREPGNLEAQRTVQIDYSFAIAAHDVTVADFKRFSSDYKLDEAHLAKLPDGSFDQRCPANRVSWYQAAAYCNWLSEKEHLAVCYKPNASGQFGSGMQPYDNYLERSGYRLPTEAEWECAARAGTTTCRYYGHADELLHKYAWFGGDSSGHLWPVGLLKPNDWGLFDTLGNALQWCEDYCSHGDADFVGKTDASPVASGQIRVARGEKFLSELPNVRIARRDLKHGPESQDFIFGFRPARTLPAH